MKKNLSYKDSVLTAKMAAGSKLTKSELAYLVAKAGKVVAVQKNKSAAAKGDV